MLTGTLQRPIALILVCLSTVSVIIPAGLVKLIKNASGFAFMSDKIKKYYENPKKALTDYKK